MKNYKACLLLTISLFSANVAADIKSDLDDMLGTGWGSLKFTSTTTLTANDLASTTRAAVSFGGMRMRTPVKSFNLINFTPGNLSYGCNGIDLTLGSFSMVSKDELISLFRSIASNALSYGFGQAIQSMCSPCWIGMKTIQEEIRGLNEAFRNTCTIAKGLVEDGKDIFLKDSKCATQATAGVSDYGECSEGSDSDKDKKGKFFKNTTAAVTALGADPRSQFKGGNLIVAILKDQGIDDSTLDITLSTYIFGLPLTTTEVTMNLLGTYNDSPDTSGQKSENLAPTIIDVEEIIQPVSVGPTSHKRGFLRCAPATSDGVTFECGAPFLVYVPSGFKSITENIETELQDLFNRMAAPGPFQASSMTHAQKFLANYIDPNTARALFLGDKKVKTVVQKVGPLLSKVVAEQIIVSYLNKFTGFAQEAISSSSQNVVGASALLSPLEKRLIGIKNYTTIVQSRLYKNISRLEENVSLGDVKKDYAISFSKLVTDNITKG